VALPRRGSSSGSLILTRRRPRHLDDVPQSLAMIQAEPLPGAAREGPLPPPRPRGFARWHHRRRRREGAGGVVAARVVGGLSIRMSGRSVSAGRKWVQMSDSSRMLRSLSLPRLVERPCVSTGFFLMAHVCRIFMPM
jgi:hypothetical protein